MDNINDLIGDAAKQLMAQADGIQNQKLKASAQRVARTVSAKTRDELISVARSDAYGRDTRFIKYLPITWRQKAVMGRVYSFQCTTNKDGTPGEFRMSLATAGKDLNITRDNLKNDLRQLVELGLLTKRSNGARKPATYLVDEVVCVTEARHRLRDLLDGGGHGEPEAVGTRYPFRHGSSAHKNRFREAMRMDDCGSEKTIHYEEEGTQDGAKA